jgi:ABC-type branched-subunit amino acid transport system substrate-binding protein
MRRSERTRPGWIAAAMLVTAMLSACTVERASSCVPAAGTSATGAAATGSSGSTKSTGAAEVPAQGVTSTTITLSMLAVDLNTLSQQGLAPNIGNPLKVAQAVVDDINANGGIGGRTLVLKQHLIDFTSAIINPENAQGDCIAATEQDRPVASIIAAALPSSLVQCVSVTHPVVSMTMNQWDNTLYKQAQGRVFSCCSNISVGMNRLFAAWPSLLIKAKGLHRGDKVGIVSQQASGSATDQADAIKNGLLPALRKAGVTVVAQAELPCPESSQTCSQQPAAIQKMKDAGATAVFLTAQALAGEATVEAAKNLDYHPTWYAVGDNTTDTEAHFYEPVKDEWNGAYGLANNFEPASAEGRSCNAIAAKAGINFQPGSDGYNFTAVTCLQVKVLASALGSIKGTITQAKLIAALEAMSTVPTISGPTGSFLPTKHDAANNVYVARYHASTGKFTPIGGSPKPQLVP